MSQTFRIIQTLERTLSELNSSREQGVGLLQPYVTIDKRNFHWLQLQLIEEMTRVEAIREQSAPDRQHDWEWPTCYLVVHERQGKRTEEIIERGRRGKGLTQIELCDMPLQDIVLTRVFKRKCFISYSFQVGRFVQRVEPQPHSIQQAPVNDGVLQTECVGTKDRRKNKREAGR